MQKRLEVTLMDKQTGPNDFLVVLPGEIIEIPQDSDKSWLTLFYSLPRELAEKWKPAYDLPRSPYEVLRTDKYDHIVCDDMFKLLVWDCYAWSAWQFFQVKDRKGNYRDIPGNWNQYAGYFPLWRLSYSIIPYIRMKFEQNGLGFQNLYNIPQGVEVPWLTYQQFSNLIGNVTDMVIAEQNWQPMIDAIWENRTVEDDINATNVKRHGDAAKRKEFLLGTNQFPNFTEKSEGKRALGPCACGCGKAEETPFKKLETTRLAADFENLRIHTEEAKTPTAFMLTIGNLAMRQARAQFSCNFLACAGYKVIDNLGFKTVEEGVDAALKAGADIVVLCSSDDEYAEYAIPAFKYLDGRAMFVVAGAPACMDDLKAAGIENFVHVRCNVLETLKEYNQKLGI